MTHLDFAALRKVNLERLPAFDHEGTNGPWTTSDWAMAVTGELGEACNRLKKRRRGEEESDTDIGYELADTIIYLDLLAAHLGIDLAEMVIAKFNIVSDRRGISQFRLAETPSALARANDLLRRARNNIGHHYVFACPRCLPESDELKADIDAHFASEAPQQ